MLVVTRKLGEQIQIGDKITITVTRVDHQQVRIGVVAPPGVTIMRSELVDEARDPAMSSAQKRARRKTQPPQQP